MYDWLTEALQNTGTVVTANRRLARQLRIEYAGQQQQQGVLAWDTPAILSWNDWLLSIRENAARQSTLATRINANQSQWLWEDCWRKEFDDDARILNLVRHSRDAWQRMADWQISISDIAKYARTEEEHYFARVAGRYLAHLERYNRIDDAGLAAEVLRLLAEQSVPLGSTLTFAGFDRQRPVMTQIMASLEAAGTSMKFAANAAINESTALHAFDSEAAELRAAGAWARAQIEQQPHAQVGIVAADLQNAADSISRAVREGATPGWQYGHHSLYDAVNVSFGRKLNEYPAIAIALIALRWLFKNIRSDDVSLLLRSTLLGDSAVDNRSQIELELRSVPDREWSPSMVTAEFRHRDDEENPSDWWTRLAALSKRRREVPQHTTPAKWAIFIDESLQALGWPGSSKLNSGDFQLMNRWRELLNDFARLAVVSPEMGGMTALKRLEMLAADTVFQPESDSASIQLLGPLEAAGAEFDGLWISGCTSANWPPPGSRSLLISRQLQEERDLPDCTPDNTLVYAQQMLTRLQSSAVRVVCSFSRFIDDAEQTASGLLADDILETMPEQTDPGWSAIGLLSRYAVAEPPEHIPEVLRGDKLSGGAAAIQRQLSDPITAFLRSRLHVNPLYPQARGIPPLVRGNLLHDALYRLYVDIPDQNELRRLLDSNLRTKIEAAVDGALQRYQRNVDATLRQLLQLERTRMCLLIEKFAAADSQREAFEIASLEARFEFVHENVCLPLRIDRLDRIGDNELAVLDYKTGAKKQLLNRHGEPYDVQLFVYASAIEATVAAVALVNVDTREIAFVGAGHGYSVVQEWPQLRDGIEQQIKNACDDLQKGDVRVLMEQGVTAARPLNLLTRYTEMLRDSR